MTIPGEPVPSGDFQLDPHEDFVFGVGLKNQVLRFGPAGGALMWATLTSILAVGIAVGFVMLDPESTTFLFWNVAPIVGNVVSIGIAAGAITNLVLRLRSGGASRPR